MHTLTLLRHSKACKATTAGFPADLAERTLTEAGIEIAENRREALGNPSYDLVIASPAQRAIQTAQIVSGGSPVVLIPELVYEDPASNDAGKLMDDLFNKLGYAPLSAYRKEEGGAELFDSFASKARIALSDTVASSGADKVLVVGHAVLLNAIGCALAHDDHTRNRIAEASIGEAEGFTFTFDGPRMSAFTTHIG